MRKAITATGMMTAMAVMAPVLRPPELLLPLFVNAAAELDAPGVEVTTFDFTDVVPELVTVVTIVVLTGFVFDVMVVFDVRTVVFFDVFAVLVVVVRPAAGAEEEEAEFGAGEKTGTLLELAKGTEEDMIS